MRRPATAARRFGRVLPAALISLIFSAFAAAQQPHVVSGTVTTMDGRPLAGAVIRVSGATGAARGTTVRTQSDANGHYRVEVPPGDYNVDGFYDLSFDGQVYREFWLHRTDGNCDRQLSENGIVRHFELRLFGPLLCTANFDGNEPTSYAGGRIQIMPGSLPADAIVRFTLTPVGPLADGTAGWVLNYNRSGAMLASGYGPLGQTAWLHDVPLGRYRISAEAQSPGGQRRTLILQEPSGMAAAAVEIGFDAKKMFPYGMQSTTVRIIDDMTAADQLPVIVGDQVDAAHDRGAGGRAAVTGQTGAQGGLPVGRYDCNYDSPYAGVIPNGRAVVILAGGRYQAWGGTGDYAFEGANVAWRSGPFAEPGVTARYVEDQGRPSLVVSGGAASDDPGGMNRCFHTGG